MKCSNEISTERVGTKNPCFSYTLGSMTKRVATYAQVSTVEQTPENQLQELRAVAKRMGWQLVDEYMDHGFSGIEGRDRRLAYDQLYSTVLSPDVMRTR